eukprot:949678-Amphidinium_carterae.3
MLPRTNDASRRHANFVAKPKAKHAGGKAESADARHTQSPKAPGPEEDEAEWNRVEELIGSVQLSRQEASAPLLQPKGTHWWTNGYGNYSEEGSRQVKEGYIWTLALTEGMNSEFHYDEGNVETYVAVITKEVEAYLLYEDEQLTRYPVSRNFVAVESV